MDEGHRRVELHGLVIFIDVDPLLLLQELIDPVSNSRVIELLYFFSTTTFQVGDRKRRVRGLQDEAVILNYFLAR
jgi:hypothetical protein